MIEFRMPSLGADMEDGTLREWLVKPGDDVRRGDIIAVVETQKGLIDIEVFNNGKIDKLLVTEDQKVPVGTVMALIIADAGVVSREIKSHPDAPNSHAIDLTKESTQKRRIKISPLARKMAAENNVDTESLKGSGEGGAITRADVEQAIANKEKPHSGISASPDSIRMAVAAAMSRSNREIPHYYLELRIDMSRSLDWLKELNKNRTSEKRVLPVVLLLKAVARALRDVPQLNAVWENGLQVKEDVNIGFVVALRTGGILIPAIRNADTKNVEEMMQALSDTIVRAREMKLRSSDLSDSTITVTSLGDNSAESVLGVIYPPQVALVGFGEITEQPWAENGMLGIRPVVVATLAADHRATDGSTGSHFLAAVRKYLQHPETL